MEMPVLTQEQINKRLSKYIKDCCETHDNFYDYSKVYFKNKNEKIKIICPIHGEFELYAYSHLDRKVVCKKCSYDKRFMTFDQFIEKTRKVHGDQYTYHRDFFGKAKEKIKITCSIHGDFWQERGNHLQGAGCFDCGVRKSADACRDTLKNFIKKARKIHGDRYDYSQIQKYNNNSTKMEIVCKEHGSFLMTANAHLSQKQNCPECALIQSTKDQILDVEIVKKRFENIHDGFYEYDFDTYEKFSSKMKMICPDHGDFWQTCSNHYNGETCRQCANKRISKSKFKGQEYFLNMAIETNGDKYDYSKSVYTGSHDKIEITCPDHGSFWTTAKSHMLYGIGCNKCSNIGTSDKEQAWLKSLNIENLKTQYYLGKNDTSGRGYSVDGYDPTTNTVYEFHGNYYHGHPDLYDQEKKFRSDVTYGDMYQNTIKKEKFIIDSGYNLVVMWEHDWDELQSE